MKALVTSSNPFTNGLISCNIAVVYHHWLINVPVVKKFFDLGFNYIPMPKYTPYILVNHEARPCYTSVPTCFSMPHLQFCFVSLLHSYELLLQLFHPYPSHDSVPLLLYTAVFSRPPKLYNCTLSVNYHAHQKAVQPSRLWNLSLLQSLKPITIAVQHLSDWLYTCTGSKQTKTACIWAIIYA